MKDAGNITDWIFEELGNSKENAFEKGILLRIRKSQIKKSETHFEKKWNEKFKTNMA